MSPAQHIKMTSYISDPHEAYMASSGLKIVHNLDNLPSIPKPKFQRCTFNNHGAIKDQSRRQFDLHTL